MLVYRENRLYMLGRRWIGACIAALALLVALPVLLVGAIAIVMEDGFPVVFTQERVGRFERRFVMYKLRTMKKALCGDAVSPSSDGDARITRVGKWLRKTSIDELPQLLNVIRGDMALVGPRPEMPFIVERYKDWQHLRHLVEPGITGLWQISGRSKLPLELPEATLLDLQYIQRVSPMTDGLLLARTMRAILSAEGAY